VILLTLLAGAALDRIITWAWRRRKAKHGD
jgi:hypothetical protein